MDIRIGAAIVVAAVLGNEFLQAETRPIQTAEAVRTAAVGQLKAVAVAWLDYTNAHDGRQPESLAELTPAYLEGVCPEALSAMYILRHHGPVHEAAASTTPLLVDVHTLKGVPIAAFWDGRVEIMSPEAFQETVMPLDLTWEPEPKLIVLENRFLMYGPVDEILNVRFSEPNDPVGQAVSGPVNDPAVRRLLEDESSLIPDIPLQDAEALDNSQVAFLIRAVQQHSYSRQLISPKAAVREGEYATLVVKTIVDYDDIDAQTKYFYSGVRLVVQPTIEADGRTIRLKGYYRIVDLAGEETQVVDGQEFSIPTVDIFEGRFHRTVPDRGTALLGSMAASAQTAPDPDANIRRFLFLTKPTISDEKPHPDQFVPPALYGQREGDFGGSVSGTSIKFLRNWSETVQRHRYAKADNTQSEDDPARQLRETMIDFSPLTREMTLIAAIDYIRTASQLPLRIVVIWKDLQVHAGIDRDTPIGIEGLGHMTIESGLNAVLSAVCEGRPAVGFVVDDGVLSIASQQSLPSTFLSEMYDVSDLLSQPGYQFPEAIVQDIIQACEPSSWAENGGEGQITDLGGVQLLIWQTPKVHEQIKQHLDQQRETMRLEVTRKSLVNFCGPVNYGNTIPVVCKTSELEIFSVKVSLHRNEIRAKVLYKFTDNRSDGDVLFKFNFLDDSGRPIQSQTKSESRIRQLSLLSYGEFQRGGKDEPNREGCVAFKFDTSHISDISHFKVEAIDS